MKYILHAVLLLLPSTTSVWSVFFLNYLFLFAIILLLLLLSLFIIIIFLLFIIIHEVILFIKHQIKRCRTFFLTTHLFRSNLWNFTLSLVIAVVSLLILNCSFRTSKASLYPINQPIQSFALSV